MLVLTEIDAKLTNIEVIDPDPKTLYPKVGQNILASKIYFFQGTLCFFANRK